MKKLKPSPEVFATVAQASGGNVLALAQRLNVARRTVYEWIEQDEGFATILEDARESLIDYSENQMILLIRGIPILDEDGKIIDWRQKPDAGLIKFHLSTKGKNRGYGGSANLKGIFDGFDPIIPREDGTPEGS